MSPKLGFRTMEDPAAATAGVADEKLHSKLARSGVEAARRKFTPEFMNRLDKIVVFQPLGTSELKKILDIELNLVQQRIFNANVERAFVFTLSNESKEYLLTEGTDMKYGARHLKRAIERLLVQPLSNLIATDQVRGGDCIRVDFDAANLRLLFSREAEGLPIQDIAKLAGSDVGPPPLPGPLVATASKNRK
jgi:ATP-dependent Clp protease ATP-binding subunit ClpA